MKKIIALSFAALGLVSCSYIDKKIQALPVTEIKFSSPYISVKEVGNRTGPSIFLIPGLGSPPEVYQDLIDKYSPRYRLHLIHLKGYAGLAAEDVTGGVFNNAASEIAKYIKTKKSKNAVLIGHSMGGELAMAINARNPGLVRRILVVDAFTYFGLLYGPNTTPQTILPNAKAFTAMTKAQDDAQYEASQKFAIARLVKSEEKRALVLDWSKKSNRHTIAQGAEDLMTIDLRPELKNNSAKITLLYAYDPMMGLTQEYVDNLYANAYKDIPLTTLKRIDNSLHFIMYDQPEKFLQEAEEFINVQCCGN